MVIVISTEAYDELIAMIERAKERETPKLDQLMRSPSPWDE